MFLSYQSSMYLFSHYTFAVDKELVQLKTSNSRIPL